MTHARLVLAIAFAVLALSSCKHEKPNFIYMPDMVYSPALKAQEEGAMRKPPEGAVSRDYAGAYRFAKEENDRAGRELRNPLRATSLTLKRGQKMYNAFCIVCHGPAGEGDGTIVPKFPRPPSLQSDKVRNWADGNIFHVITTGQNLMPSYAAQIVPEDRWAIIHYVRALQRSKHPTAEDIKAHAE